MNLMRHTSHDTTTLYTRTVTERMKEAVQNLGKPLEAGLGAILQLPAKKTQNNIMRELLVRLVKA